MIWMNGAFGSGKTNTAFELHRRIPGSIVYDPEQAGYFIRSMMPKPIALGDFQHYPMWRDINYSMLRYLAHSWDGVILVPMTIVEPDIFQEIVGRLREEGFTVNHFTLCASKETLHKRLRSRGEGRNSWASRQIERCLQGLSDERFEFHLDTEHLTVEETAEAIAARLGIPLLPDHRGRLRKRLDRLLNQFKHIHWFHR